MHDFEQRRSTASGPTGNHRTTAERCQFSSTFSSPVIAKCCPKPSINVAHSRLQNQSAPGRGVQRPAHRPPRHPALAFQRMPRHTGSVVPADRRVQLDLGSRNALPGPQRQKHNNRPTTRLQLPSKTGRHHPSQREATSRAHQQTPSPLTYTATRRGTHGTRTAPDVLWQRTLSVCHWRLSGTESLTHDQGSSGSHDDSRRVRADGLSHGDHGRVVPVRMPCVRASHVARRAQRVPGLHGAGTVTGCSAPVNEPSQEETPVY